MSRKRSSGHSRAEVEATPVEEELDPGTGFDDEEPVETDPFEGALWCEECHRLVEAEAVGDDGLCPRCGNELREAEAGDLQRRRVPWTFKAMIGASIIYLGYRAYQGIGWMAHHL